MESSSQMQAAYGMQVAINRPPSPPDTVAGLAKEFETLINEASENLHRAINLADRLTGPIPEAGQSGRIESEPDHLIASLRLNVSRLAGIVAGTRSHLQRIDAALS